MALLHFTARTMQGAGRGKRLGTPTINLVLDDVPKDLQEGIYACRTNITDMTHDAVMHFGPRPVFHDTTSCEVHVLDQAFAALPESITVDIIAFLRPVADFLSPEALQTQIAEDIRKARALLR